MTSARVVLWGTTIGTVSLNNSGIAVFEYDPAFISSSIEVCPLMMPLQNAPYSFPALSIDSFSGLPGMLSDSLPDRFGNTLIDAWLMKRGRPPGSMNAVERLCYTGTRGMGALEFYPEINIHSSASEIIEVDELAQLASDILSKRESYKADYRSGTLEQLISIGTSAGGARAKAVIAINPKTGDIRSGQIDAGQDYEYWIIKFDRIENNRDKEYTDDPQHTLIEYAYYLMAVLAGIDMNECRIISKEGNHFLTKRFDRTNDGGKIHMLSLAGMAHYDFNRAGEHSYEDIADILRQIDAGYHDIRQVFRRMVFNHLARNYDDHIKNTSFLMDRSGHWRLAPAYDISYAYNPTGAWTSRHQMMINGKTSDVSFEDLVTAGQHMGISSSDISRDMELVDCAINRWMEFADKTGLREDQACFIKEMIVPL